MVNVNFTPSVSNAANVNSTISRNYDTKSQLDNSNDFENTLKKSSQDITKASQIRNSDENISQSKVAGGSINDKVPADEKNENKKENLDEKLKEDLKKAGFSDEDIKKLEAKVSEGDIDENSLIYLLNILLPHKENLKGTDDELVDKISDEISDKIGDKIGSKISSQILKNLQSIMAEENTVQNKNLPEENIVDKIVKKNAGEFSDVLQKLGVNQEFSEKLTEKLSSSILSKLSNGQDLQQSVYNKIKNEINSALAGQMNLNNQEGKSSVNLSGFKVQNINQEGQTNLINTLVVPQNEDISQNDSGKSGDKNSEAFTGNDDKILKRIMEGGTGDKISKAANFMSQFTSVNTDNTVENLKNLVINQNSLDSDVIKTLKYMDVNNIKELTVKVNPKELGEITINLVMEEGKLKAVITASNKDAYNLLNSNLQDLSNKLQTNDIKVQSFSLNLYNEDATFFRDESKKGQQQNSSGQNKELSVDNISAKEEVTEDDYYYDNNVNILA
ncbi:flagellar hook-length control protein FliK [Clostridium sp. JNZ X4-2]